MKNVLVVDDSASMRQMVKMTLDKEYNVTTANDGSEGLSFAKRNKYDIIVTDINMPNMNGYEMIESIRRDSKNQSTPIICLTTESSANAKTKAKDSGATGWIIKPFSPEKLLGTLSRLV